MFVHGGGSHVDTCLPVHERTSGTIRGMANMRMINFFAEAAKTEPNFVSCVCVLTSSCAEVVSQIADDSGG